ncbi:transcriptional repressor [Methylococcus sp. EFPC2]|uniref:transcriptional repressor n=1 Tax=Methylococcus sp. EFPC2 TaxID=2812648 RepID=UPI001966D1AB|nr:transcriptional repressor [Methylococcus sp. EFPC2]QSA95808.1 transcriptional repressor [Methylococcus sp. EFPC2]
MSKFEAQPTADGTPFSGSEAATANPHNHAGCIERALDIAERLCGLRGVRLTPIRRKVLELIWESHRAVKAYDLLDKIRPFECAAKPVTVYRALEFLIEQGLVHRVESLNAFVGCVSSESEHELLLLICERCHEVEERPAKVVMAALAVEIREAGFQAHRKAVEIHGLCAHCAASD